MCKGIAEALLQDEDAGRPLRAWSRVYRDSYQILYAFNKDLYGREPTPLIYLLKEEQVWSVWFVTKEGEYLANTKQAFDTVNKAVAYAKKLMIDFNTGKLDSYKPLLLKGGNGDAANWTMIKENRDRKLGRKKFLWW